MPDTPNNRKRTRSEDNANADLVAPSSPMREAEPFDSDALMASESHLLDDLPDSDANDSGEDLFGSDLIERDYRENDRLDRYDTADVDDEMYSDLDLETRQLVEAKLKRRDREIARREGIPAAFLDDEDDYDMPMKIRRRRRMDPELEDLQRDMGDLSLPTDILQEIKGSLQEYVSMDGPRRAIQKEFRHFLTSFVDDRGESVYGNRIRAMCTANGESLEISFLHLQQFKAILAYYVANSPMEVLKIFDGVASSVVHDIFEDYHRIKPEIHVRISDLPATESLRDLRQIHLNTLIRVSGVVTRRTAVYPQLTKMNFDCVKCGQSIGPIYQLDPTDEVKISFCPSCQSRGPFSVNATDTLYRNYQRLTLQEEPGSVPAGRLPRHKEVILLWDLIDSARPGDMIEITGVYRNNFDTTLNAKNGFPVFTTLIEANHVSKKEDMFAASRLTEDDIRSIRTLAQDPRIADRVISSIAPSIYGHEDIKTALALAMFGGVPKNPQEKHKIRGDINVLMLGDPGTAKSQFLKYVEKTANRAVYATGQGASAVGLTATVHKDPVSREWTLEGGALVMADKGVCLIDEFDKMNDKDRTSIHEAMEQQSISISKAGIIATLPARCAVIAAANPIRGRYNSAITFSQNVELTEPILSRFDILCVVEDKPDAMIDEHLARFVLNSHIRHHIAYEEGTLEKDEKSMAFQEMLKGEMIPQELLRKYIMYARDRIRPRFPDADREKLASYYSDLRRESKATGSIPITVRHLESIVRMSEAFARMQLKETVSQQDIDRAISVMTTSFVKTQKENARRELGKTLKKYATAREDNEDVLYHLLSDLISEHYKYSLIMGDKEQKEIKLDAEELELKAQELGILDVKPFYSSKRFRLAYCTYDGTERKIVKKLEA